jgi:hypothetical protein
MAERSIMNSFGERDLEYVDTKWPHKFSIHGYFDKPTGDPASRPVYTFSDWSAIWNKDEAHPAGFEADYEFAKKNDILTCILVPDEEKYYRMALDLGCTMFTSDDPSKAIEILKDIGAIQ